MGRPMPSKDLPPGPTWSEVIAVIRQHDWQKANLMARLTAKTEEWHARSTSAAAARLAMRTATDASARADKAEWLAWQAVLSARHAVEGATNEK